VEIAKSIAPICLAIIMFGLGLGLTAQDFLRVVKNPKDFLIGFLSQVILLPIVAIILISLISLPVEIAMGVMVIAAAPGGVTSNILTKFADGDVALSVTLTAVVSLLSIIIVPLIVFNSANYLGIEIVKEDIFLGDIGSTIQNHVEAEGFSVVQDFCGHGIGKEFHKEPNVLHYGKKGTGEKIKAGMIFTIEPMINLGKYETKTLNDGWTAVTKDKSLSAQFEHTIGVTKDGYEIFTL